MLGLGSDICDIRRIERSLERFGERFIQRVFTSIEIAKAERRSGQNRSGTYAKRFAAKEACAKALGTGFGKELSFQDIEILNDAAGKPHVFLSPKASAHFNNPSFHLSLSHCHEYATATVIASH